MPTPSAYILAAVLVGPALARLGYPVLESHMFLLYYAVLSALTPPIAVAALAAAAIADEDPFKIAFTAVKLAIVGFLLPFAFIWNPGLMLLADPLTNAVAVIGGALATIAIAFSVEGFGASNMRQVERGLLAALAILAVCPSIVFAVIGIAGIAGILARHYLQSNLLERHRPVS